jgi:lysozyme family protein
MKYTPKLAAEYRKLWDGLIVVKKAEAYNFARKILINKVRYQRIEKATSVPWHFIALAHYRESTLNFSKNLANGQPLNMRTTIVPKDRGPYVDFEQSAIDSLVNVQKYKKGMDWSLPAYIWRIEGYNGYGYHYKGIPSPYLVGGSNKQKRGKYIADGLFDGNHWDTQLGVLTILKALIDLDPSIKFGGTPAPKPVEPLPPPPDIEPPVEGDEEELPPSPRADGDTKPVVKSKTIIASILGIVSSIAAFITDWRVLTVIVIAFFAFIMIDRMYPKLDIKGWFRS